MGPPQEPAEDVDIQGNISDEDLTDEQIEQLLQQAETRLKAQSLVPNGSKVRPAIPLPVKQDSSSLPQPYVQTDGDIARADSQRLLDLKQRRLANGIRIVEDPTTLKQRKLAEKKATAGPNWFHLPRTNLTPSLKRDLQLIKMRSVLDPKQHYKKDNSRATIPEFSQIGTIVEGPADFYSSRLTKRERRRNLVEEVLEGEQGNGKFRKKYLEIQAAKTSGKKGDYKKRMAQKYGRKFRR